MAFQSKDKNEYSIGIDLGTTNSSISYYDPIKGDSVLIQCQNINIFPSFVSLADLEKDKTIRIGDIAKNNPNAEFALYDAKRLIGKSIDDISELQLNSWSFIVEEERVRREKEYEKHLKMYTKNPKTKQLDGFHPFEVSGFVLRYLMLRFKSEYPNIQIKNIVVTVPTNFNEEQRKQTELAAELAGFKVTRLLNEPTAAVIDYKNKCPQEFAVDKDKDKDKEESKKFLVIDFGGGTLDVCVCENIIEMKDGKQNDRIHVIATGGDPNLGGNDFDIVLMEIIKDKFEENLICRREYFEKNEDDEFDDEEDEEKDKNFKISSRGTNEEKAKRLLKLKKEAERIKIEFSQKEEGKYLDYIPIQMDILFNGVKFKEDEDEGKEKDQNNIVSYEEFKNRCKDGWQDEDDNIIPETQLIKRFKKVISDVLRESHLTKTKIDKVLMVGGSCAMRLTQEMVLEIFNNPNKIADTNHFNPLTAVCKGAAYVSHTTEEALQTEVYEETIPYSIGIEGEIDNETCRFIKLVKAGDHLPATKTKEFITTRDNQDKFIIKIFAGNQERTNVLTYGIDACETEAYMEKLDEITINIPKKPKGQVTLIAHITVNRSGKLDMRFISEGQEQPYSRKLQVNKFNSRLHELSKHFDEYPFLED